MKSLLELARKYRCIYIYGFGLAGKWLSAELSRCGLQIAGFIDTDEKKAGFHYNGYSVNTPDAVFEVVKALNGIKSDTLIINTVVDIQDLWETLVASDLFDVVALGIYLDEFSCHEVEEAGPEYVRYSLDAVKASHKSYFKEAFRFVRSVDLQVTERCTMKCQDCSNLMQYYEKPVNVSHTKLVNDMAVFLSKIDRLFEIRIIGGEPFVHPSIYELLEEYSNSEKIDYVTIFTNSTIRLDEERLRGGNIVLNRLSFSITNYGGKNSRNISFNKDILERLRIKHRIHEPEWWTDSGRVLDTAHSERFAQELFEKCCGKNLFTIYDGKLYRCPFASNADTLKAIPFDARNYVSIDSPAENLTEYMNNNSFIPACQYCKGRSWDSPIIDAAVQTRQPLSYSRKQ